MKTIKAKIKNAQPAYTFKDWGISVYLKHGYDIIADIAQYCDNTCI